jgi:geranylgeranyl diphosphate synthase type II
MNEDRIALYREYIERYLQDFYQQWQDEPQTRLYDAISYSLLAGGKRLRPILAFEFCRLCGREWQAAAPFAAAVEMIHTYSLIHDDLPCMDNDDFRRGRPTNHKVYGEAMAVLSGDALLTDAFCAAAMAKLPNPADMATAIGVLSECAGSHGMVGGQVLDIMSEERLLSEQEVLDIQSRKTGALIKAACLLGVLAGQGSNAQFKAAADFAQHLGLAFQIRDDMLDVIGNAEELGKAVGVDTVKNTFVQLYGLEKCDAIVHAHTDEAKGALNVFADPLFMLELADTLVGRTM